MKILIVDDEPIALEILRASLECAGHEVLTANDGNEALESLSRGDIRLVITDWDMPNLDGLALCRAIRKRSCASYVYIILLTSHGSTTEVVEGMSAGADDFIVKPFDKHELNERIRAGERVLSLESRDVVIFSLAKLAESRDPETGMHLERVQRYARRLAESLAENTDLNGEIDADFIRLVYQTSPLHDIGKVGVPDSVLLKPGRLTAEEFEVMKTHTTIGSRTLAAALDSYPHARFLEVARDIAACHHERWDGQGYPAGPARTQIPLSARIVALADVYDALTSERAYKPAYSHDVARDIIVRDSGKHFDPRVVDAFQRVESDFIEICTRFHDRHEKQTPRNMSEVSTVLA